MRDIKNIANGKLFLFKQRYTKTPNLVEVCLPNYTRFKLEVLKKIKTLYLEVKKLTTSRQHTIQYILLPYLFGTYKLSGSHSYMVWHNAKKSKKFCIAV